MQEIVSGDEVEGIWSSIKSVGRKVGKAGKAVGRTGYRAGKTGYRAGRAGYGAATRVARAASPYLPAAAAALAAAKLVRSARKGNVTARKRVVNMRQAAKAGDPEAQKAAAVVQAVSKTEEAQADYQPEPEQAVEEQWAEEEYGEAEYAPDEEAEYSDEEADSVGGWLFQKGYRSNIQAAEGDAKNPWHAMRALYNRGMGKGVGTMNQAVDLGKKLLGL